MHGLSKLLETVQLIPKRVNRELKVGGIVFVSVRRGDAARGRGCRGPRDILRRKAQRGCPVGRRQVVSNANPPQHPPRGMPEFRPVDLPVLTDEPRRGRLRVVIAAEILGECPGCDLDRQTGTQGCRGQRLWGPDAASAV